MRRHNAILCEELQIIRHLRFKTIIMSTNRITLNQSNGVCIPYIISNRPPWRALVEDHWHLKYNWVSRHLTESWQISILSKAGWLRGFSYFRKHQRTIAIIHQCYPHIPNPQIYQRHSVMVWSSKPGGKLCPTQRFLGPFLSPNTSSFGTRY